MSILEFLGFGKAGWSREASGASDTDSVRKIVDELDHMDPERARFVAAFAYVLSRVAGADMKVSDHETREMERIVTEQGGLTHDQAIIVVQMAKHQNLLFGGTENYLVTRELNHVASREQKLALVDCLFAVSAADETISTTESSVIRQIAAELQLDHADYISVRARHSDNLGVLKTDDPGTDPR
jgi:uncharacterized tellurite resistance protein B-like protein